MGVSNKNKYYGNISQIVRTNARQRNTQNYPGSALRGLRPVPLQNPIRAFTSTKNMVHLTIFDQEIASPTLSSTARKIVTQTTQSLQHKELM